MRVHLQVSEERIVEARFETYNCPWAAAVGAATVKWLQGRPIAQAKDFGPQTVEPQLAGLPRSKRRLLLLATQAFQDALAKAGPAPR